MKMAMVVVGTLLLIACVVGGVATVTVLNELEGIGHGAG